MMAGSHPLDDLPDPRWELMLHLQGIEAKRAAYQEVVAQHRRLHELIDVEVEAKAKVDHLKLLDARNLADELADPGGSHSPVDHLLQQEAELELERARREADAARACRPAVVERATAASLEVAALEERTLPMAVQIMIEDAREIAAEIDADARRLRAKYARLWGLRRYLGDTPAVLKRLEDVPQPFHPDNIAPHIGELIAGAEAWRRLAARLVADPEARIEEKAA